MTVPSRVNARRSWPATRLRRVALILWLVAALLLGPMAIAGASEFGTGSMPCQMQMGALDQQPSPDQLPDPSHQKIPLACPMMAGGLCMMLFKVAPVLASLPIPPPTDIQATRLNEAVAPHVVSLLKRPPRSF